MRALLAAALVLLAGCASAPEAAPASSSEAGTGLTEGTGGIHVIVVDEGIRPIANASIQIASTPAGAGTNADGALTFTDLPPGSYIVTASAPGYLQGQATAVVVAGEFTTLRITLQADRRPAPYHVTYPLEGLMEAWGGIAQFLVEDATGGTDLCTCRIVATPEPDLVAIVYEAFWTPTLPDPGALGQFYWFVRQTDGQGLQQGDYCFSPCQVAVGTGPYVQGSELEFRLDGPDLWPAIEQHFELFVTLWYHLPPPAGWSIADETP